MPDIISLLHRSVIYPHLFEDVVIGKFRLSIQAGRGWASYPKIDGLHPYQYKRFEVAFYPLPPLFNTEGVKSRIAHEFVVNNIWGGVSSRDLQRIYNILECYNKLLKSKPVFFASTHEVNHD